MTDDNSLDETSTESESTSEKAGDQPQSRDDEASLSPESISEETPVEEVVARVGRQVDTLDRDLRGDVLGGMTETVIEDWTSAFSHVRPGVGIEREDNARLQQVRQFYERHADKYEELASELSLKSYRGLTPGQVLFMSDLRQLQATFREQIGTEPNINPQSLKDLFHDRIKVDDPDSQGGQSVLNDELSDLKGHPIGERLLPEQPAMAYRVTDPPGQLREILVHRALPIESERDAPEPGDIVYFHTTGSVGNDSESVEVDGYIGCALLGERVTGEHEWSDGFLTDEPDTIYSFERLYLNGEVEEIDLSRRNSEVSAHPQCSLQSELKALTANANRVGESATRATGRSDQMEASEIVSESIVVFRTLRPVLKELPPTIVGRTFNGSISQSILDGLCFEENRGQRILENVEAALRSGKSVMLTGPPGTGKTEIAERVLEYLAQAYPNYYTGFRTTTATADWSTFDTVGGYMPDRGAASEQLVFSPGLVTSCFYDRQDDRRLNEPLLVDELNRADIDKAFGQLFTALTNKTVQLPFENEDGTPLKLVTPERSRTVPKDEEFVLSRNWSLIATINTYDKTSLYEMSYAFMRRFAFIRVDAPTIPKSQSERNRMLAAYADAWGHEITQEEMGATASSPVGQLFAKLGDVWYAINSAIENRSIGPAILKDISDTVLKHPKWPDESVESGDVDSRIFEELRTDAIVAYILPQFEGVPERKEVVIKIAQITGVESGELVAAARSSLDLPDLTVADLNQVEEGRDG